MKTHPKLDVAGEEGNALVLVEWGLDKGRSDDALLATDGSEESMREFGGG